MIRRFTGRSVVSAYEMEDGFWRTGDSGNGLEIDRLDRRATAEVRYSRID